MLPQRIVPGPVHLVALVLAAIIPTATACTSDAEPAPAASPPENLRFTGAITGHLSVGAAATEPVTTNPTPPITESSAGTFTQAAPSATQCATFPVSGLGDDYVAVILGDAGPTRIALTVEINTDNAAYRSPGTALRPGTNNDGGSVELAVPDGSRRWQQVLGPHGQTPARVTLHPDRRSGDVDAWLGPTDQSQYDSPAQVHVSGTWRC